MQIQLQTAYSDRRDKRLWHGEQAERQKLRLAKHYAVALFAFLLAAFCYSSPAQPVPLSGKLVSFFVFPCFFHFARLRTPIRESAAATISLSPSLPPLPLPPLFSPLRLRPLLLSSSPLFPSPPISPRLPVQG